MPALRREDIAPERLAALNAGLAESRVLVEWLAMDHGALLSAVLTQRGQPLPPEALLQELPSLPGPKRMTAIAAHLHSLRDPDLVGALHAHRSDSVRIWAALLTGLEPHPDVRSRVNALRPPALDPNAGVREYAWMALRPHLADQLEAGLQALVPLAHDPHPYLRRFASEASRPRGVWCAHLRSLRQHPEQAEALLEPLRADPDRYVQNSVANWLNDASKDRPDWVSGLTDRWRRESPTPETAYILRRALRTLRKGAP